jgi:hypothetical protein
MSTFYYFVQSVPECMGLIALSLAFAQVPLRWGRIFLGGAFLSLLTFGIRALPVNFGFHLPISILVIFLLIVKLAQVPPSRTIISVFAGFFILVLLEMVVSYSYFAFTHMNYQQAMANEGAWAAVGVLQSIILNIIALIVARFFKSTRRAWKI